MSNALVTNPRTAKVFIYSEPVSMACSFPKLQQLVENMENAPSADSGNLYLFTNKKHTYVKVLFYLKGGLCILAKKLDHGKFILNFAGKVITIPELGKAMDPTKKTVKKIAIEA